MIYARIEAHPNKTTSEHAVYGGALVNCWINREDVEEAVSIARRMIAERGWHSGEVEEARPCLRHEFPIESQEYFDQALTDQEVIVFFAYPRNSPN